MVTMNEHAGVIPREAHVRRASLFWKVRNFPNVWRGLWRIALARALGVPTMYGSLRAYVTHADGSITDYGLVSLRVVTTAGGFILRH